MTSSATSKHSTNSAAPVGRDIFAWGSVILAAVFVSFYVRGLPMADIDTRTHVACAIVGIAYSAGAVIVLFERLSEAAVKHKTAKERAAATPSAESWSAAGQA